MKIPKLTIIHFFLFIFFISGQIVFSQTTNLEPPNIIVIIPDDLGWRDVGYNGSEIKTPNIDRLAQTGVRLDQHYVMPTCTPTRVSLFTGKYPSRYGITGPDYGEVIDQGDPTLASLLAKQGYSTHLAGKWHMGSPPYTPLKYGFQTSYGYFDGQIDPYTHEYKQETERTSRRSWHRNDQYLDEEGHATDLITAEAVRVIENSGEAPFFLYVAYSVPHFPLDEPGKWKKEYQHLNLFPSRQLFAASVTHMDHGIGEIIQALEQTGQKENTLVLFISDNGGQKSWHSETEYRGKYADQPHHVLGNNFPLRGWKGDLYEGGIRVPAIANWPGHLEPNTSNAPIHVSDWLPTVVHFSAPQSALKQLKLDGKNIWPVLSGGDQIEEAAMYWKTKPASAVRSGKWKLILHHPDQKPELFDLENDFREMNDVSTANPEKVSELMDLMEKIKEGDR